MNAEPPGAPPRAVSASGEGAAADAAGRIKAAAIALPKAGGAIKGIGADFQNGGFTGAATLSIPIPTTSCRGGTPSLALQYQSGGGNGTYGLGFAVGLPAITCQTSKGQPRYDGSDIFLLPDGTPMVRDPAVPVGYRDGHEVVTYRPRLESGFSLIEHWVDGASRKSFWRILASDNSQTFFGRDDGSRIADPLAPTHIFSWLVDAELMARGDAITYRYRAENDDNVPPAIGQQGHAPNANKYPDRILYGNDRPVYDLAGLDAATWHFEIVFDYGEYALDPLPPTPCQPPPEAQWLARPDPFSVYDAGFEIRTYRLCRHVLMFHRFADLGAEPLLVQFTRLTYDETPVLTMLRTVEAIGCSLVDGIYAITPLPPLELGYTAFAPTAGRFEPLVDGSGRPVPGALQPGPFQLTDLYGEGIPGILFQSQGTILFMAPQGPQPAAEAGAGLTGEAIAFGPPGAPARFPGLGLDGGAALVDVTGCGRPALVVAAPDGTRFSQAQTDGSWAPFRDLPAVPSQFFLPDTMTADLTGDGLTDLLCLDPQTIRVFPSHGAEGYGPAFQRPRAVDMPMGGEGHDTVLIRMADMFGSGREHLVKIANGSVEVWPNLGYGRFGQRIAMGNAPHFGDDFDTGRLYLADIDGSGTADLLYLHHDRIDLYVNQSGNSFAAGVSIPLPGGWQPGAAVQFADVRGNGAAALVYAPAAAAGTYLAYDFGCKTKPYLLDTADNNMGLVTTIAYRSSTFHALRDRQEGIPWATELPFPVQVVDTVEVLDGVSGTRLVSRYDYHHGYYDIVEREFCGFGQVDCIDSISLDDYLAATPGAEANSYTPPSLTRTWYHTGAWGPGARPCDSFAAGYFQGDPAAPVLPPASFALLEADPGGETMRQAHYALKGMMLREEVYGLDGSPLADVPYEVGQSNYCVRQDQAVQAGGNGVFFVYPLEELTLHYERNPEDPRIAHDVTLAVDAFGAVLRSCSIAYARRPVPGRLPEQAQLQVTVATDQVTDLLGLDLRLLGLAVEGSGWLLIAPEPPAGAIFTVDEISAQVDAALQEPASKLQLLSRERHTYWDPATGQPLPLGQATGQGLVCRIAEAVDTPAALGAAYSGVLTADELEALLDGTCKYVFADGLWWNPGVLQTFLGADHFFLAGNTVDPFGGVTSIRYDACDLMVVRSEDALGNVEAVTGIDYAAMAPWQTVDANGTVHQALCDALGFVWATSVQGGGPAGPVGFAPLTLNHQAPAFDMAAALAAPQAYLQGTGSYAGYALFSWCGRIAVSDLEGLGGEPAALWRALIDGFYIARSGAVLGRCRDRARARPETLGGVSAGAVWARIAALTTPTPVHSVALAAETYNVTGRTQYAGLYFDGSGRELQRTAKVDSGECYRVEPDGTVTIVDSDDRWVVSGRVVYNNKGNPIKQYEPFFVEGWAYVDNAELNRFGVSPLIFYDPLDREIRIDTPKGFFSRSLFSPWEERLYDNDDTVKDSPYYKANIDNPDLDPLERAALEQAAVFNDTPTIRQFDPCGNAVRVIQTVVPPLQPAEIEGLTTRNIFDAMGRLIASADERMWGQGLENLAVVFSLDGQRLKSACVDSGLAWALNDAAGNPVFGRDARGTVLTTTYDLLQRPLDLIVQMSGGAPFLARRTVYGESVADGAGRNLRGEVYQVFDSAGAVTFDAYSIDGKVLQQTRQLLLEVETVPDWDKLDPDAIYQTEWTFDALARVLTQSVGRRDDPRPELVTYVYDAAGYADTVSLTPSDSSDPEVYADRIVHDARGQRRQIIYGNGVATEYTYDPTTQFLTRVVSIRSGDGFTLQSLRYYYDPVGNITAIVDDAQSTVFNANQQVDPLNTYVYDAAYRLIKATGREHPALSAGGSGLADRFLPLAALNDGQALQNYTRRYRYDGSGNLVETSHQGAVPATFAVTVSPTSNRAVEAALTTDPARVDAFFDANGNQVAMLGMPAAEWDYNNRLAAVTLVDRGDGSPDIELYVYDSEGRRVRKVTRRQGAGGAQSIDETLYIDGLEIRRHLSGGVVDEEYRTIRVMDGERCLAERLSWTIGGPPAGVPSPQIRYQLENYLGSAVYELDKAGLIITYEEYFPYGTTSYIAGDNAAEVKLKHYRYAGNERDDGTGLYYCGARYYQPGVGRWLSADPSGPAEGLNLYCYVGDNPIVFIDPNGLIRILVVGEGRDFSYSYALAGRRRDDQIIVTQYALTRPPDQKPDNVTIYEQQLDVTSPQSWASLDQWREGQGLGRFDAIVFNNPHAGYGTSKLQVMGVDQGYAIERGDPAYEHAGMLHDFGTGTERSRSQVFDSVIGRDRYRSTQGMMGLNEHILRGFFHLGRSLATGRGSLTVFTPATGRNVAFINRFMSGDRESPDDGPWDRRRFRGTDDYRNHRLGVDYQSNLTDDDSHPSWGRDFHPRAANLNAMRGFTYARSRSPTPGLPDRPPRERSPSPRRGRTQDRERKRGRSRSRSRSPRPYRRSRSRSREYRGASGSRGRSPSRSPRRRDRYRN